jgi:phosphotransferase system enzyme I (PtsP)
MIEVPSLVWQLGALLPLVDFVSVGSNDLIQFFFASDRANPQVSGHYDFLSPTVLGLLRHILAECRTHNVPVSLCGEAAGRPLEAMALIGLGFRTISMPPARIGPVKLMARGLHVDELVQFMDDLFLKSDHSVRHLLKEYAEKSGVIV